MEKESVELTTAAGVGIASALIGAGTSWGIMRNKVSNLEEDHDELKADVAELKATERNVIDRLARIETKLDMALQRSK